MSGIWDCDTQAVDLEELRRFARERCKYVSLRAMAMEVGIGRTTFHKFIAGDTSPQPPIRHRLHVWYHAHANGEAARKVRAVAEVLDGLPHALLHIGADKILDVVEEAHRNANVAVPAWILFARNESWRAD